MSLLPANATPLERAIESVFAARLDAIPAEAPDTLWDPATCPEVYLPWLAWALEVETWNPTWELATRRQVVADALEVHRRRGTVGAVRRALTAAGFAPTTIQEGMPRMRYDGTRRLDGTWKYSSGGSWARYLLRYALEAGLPWSQTQLAEIRRIAEHAAPRRSELAGVAYTEPAAAEGASVADAGATGTHRRAYRYNGAWQYDGAVHYGADVTVIEW